MNFLTRLIKHELITGTFLVFVGSMIGNVFAFLLNLFLARNLSYSDYGIYASLLSVITLALIPAGSINTIILRFSSNYLSKGELDKLKSFYKKIGKFLLLLSLGIFLVFAILSPLVRDYLHLDNTLYVFVVGAVLFISYLQTLNLAFIQGLMKFGFLSFVYSFNGLLRLVMSIFLVFLGFKAYGGLGAMFFMALGSFLICFIPMKNFLIKKEQQIHIPTKEITDYALPAFFVVLFMTSFTSSDVILVKHFFSSQQAGLYAGLSLVGKVIFYFTAPIPSVMFPLVIKRYNLGANFNKLFYLAIGLVFIPSFLITGFYFLYPDFVIKLFLGGRGYMAIAPYAGLFAFYLMVFSLLNLVVVFFLSLNKIKITPLVVLGALIQIILISNFHSDFYQIIGISILISFVLFVLLMIYYLKLYSRLKIFKNTVIPPSSPAV